VLNAALKGRSSTVAQTSDTVAQTSDTPPKARHLRSNVSINTYDRTQTHDLGPWTSDLGPWTLDLRPKTDALDRRARL